MTDQNRLGQAEVYDYGNLIYESFGLTELSDVADAPHVLGASRLFILPDFSPEQIITP